MKFFTKKIQMVLIICLLVFQTITLHSEQLSETGNLAMLARVWGFLKYYHPQSNNSIADWDDIVIEFIPKAKIAVNGDEFSEIVNEMIYNAGSINPIDFSDLTPDEDIINGSFFQWINNSDYFSPKIRFLLKLVLVNIKKPNSFTNYTSNIGTINPENEPDYSSPYYPDEEKRLLCLFRFWNIIHYFFPYKDLMDCSWDDTLHEMIPKFISAKNALEYALAVRELTARIDDTHASLSSFVLYLEYWGQYYPPFLSKTIEGKIVITELLDKTIQIIQKGDIIEEVDGETVDKFRNKNYRYLPASNSSVKERELNNVICRGKSKQMRLLIRRDQTLSVVGVDRIISSQYFDLLEKITMHNPVWKILPDNIGYVNMGRMNDVPATMSKLMDTKAIIFDIRNYPNFILYELAQWLNDRATPFVKITVPNRSKPGFFTWKAALTCGTDDPGFPRYQGKVVILFDESTQSRAEFTCMALQTAPDVISIGSQTAGADGNVVKIVLPGGMFVYFSGLGIYYPDGRETQRIGLVPDILVKPTISGIRNGVDEVLQRAILHIKEH
jgi:C-terminal processing protease CtpA/Prc